MHSVPMRPVTRGPKFHWFGYYDKWQFDESGRYALGMEVGFEGRSPRPEDEIALGLIDLKDEDRWSQIGRTQAWCWQQGCMLQWRPGSAREIVWNAREDDAFVCRVLDMDSGQTRTLPRAVYSLSPDGKTAVCTDFRRIQDMRPGYGYAGLPDPNAGVLAPDDVGIWVQDMDTGASELIVSVAQIVALPYPHGDLSAAKHYFNHLLFSPDGSRFIFLHRWRFGDGPFHTRMLTAALDGTDVRVVDDYGKTSHFIWRDPAHILAWSWHPSAESAFYLYGDGGGKVDPVGQGAMRVNGHCTYMPDVRWVLNDTYPLGAARTQELYLYDVESDRRVELGALTVPAEYTDEWRCDLHPRANRAGTQVLVDSAHAGGRQMYLLDVSDIL